jgi:hypothetical protein
VTTSVARLESRLIQPVRRSGRRPPPSHPSGAERWILLEARHMPGPGCIADERGLPDPLTERTAHAIHDPAVRAREPRGAHTPIDVAVRRELPGAPPHVPDPEAVGNEARQGLLDRVLRLRRGSTPRGRAAGSLRPPSRDDQREQCSHLHAGKTHDRSPGFH